MTYPNFRIVPRNFHDEAALTPSYELPGFPSTNTQNTARDATWMPVAPTSTLSGVWPDDGRKVNFFGMFRHGWHGGYIQLQLFNQIDLTGLVYDSGALPTVSLTTLGNFDWGTDALGIVKDPFVSESPFWLYFDPVGAASYTITLSDPMDQVQGDNPAVGRFFMGSYFEIMLQTPLATMGFVDNTEKARSRGGSNRSNVGAYWRTLEIDLPYVFDADRAAWIDICRQCGMGRDVVVSTLPSDPVARLERDYIINGKFLSLDALGRTAEYLTKKVVIEEN